MKTKFAVVMLAILVGASAALAASKSYSYICMNTKCKSYKQVFTYSENIRYEHKCPTCGQRLDDK